MVPREEGGRMKAPLTAPPVETQFAQKLAANDKKDRDRAVKKLKKWLGSRGSAFPQEDMMRIWKGLFYCFWMSDKPLVQEELAESISSMVGSFQTTEGSLGFVACFAKTFQREWFGIDRWRKDKTMMFVRRFLRQLFRLLATSGWEEEVVASAADIVRHEVVLTGPAHSSLGFQLHFTDVFLEELAKVGGEELPARVVEVLVQPWVELVATSTDRRLREHAEERIFNHLLRQSDAGIQYQEEEEGGADGEEEGDSGDDETEAGDGAEAEEGSEAEEEEVEEAAQDPRAGRVDVVIPQVPVEYVKISENLFKLGSGENVRKNNRDALYRISKKFKDVSENIFPLGPNLDDLDMDVPKIHVKKAVADLSKRNEKIRKDNLEGKRKAKLDKKQMKLATPEEDEDDGLDDENNFEEREDGGASEDDEAIVVEKSDNEDEEEPAEKKPKRENQKKKKQERKRLKREALLKKSLEKAEKDRKLQDQLDHDLQTTAVLKDASVNGEKASKKKRKNASSTNVHSSPVKKAKIDSSTEEMPVQNGKEVEGGQKIEKKKKKHKETKAQADVTGHLPEIKEIKEHSIKEVKEPQKNKKNYKHKEPKPQTEKKTDVVESLTEQMLVEEPQEIKKKKKKRKHEATEENTDVAESLPEQRLDTVGEETDKQVEISEQTHVKDKKLKKKKKELHRIDSDICFNAPSLSKTNLPDLVPMKKPPMAAIEEVSTPDLPVSKKKKKLTKYNAETSLLAAPKADTPLKGEKLDFGPATGKVFEETAWELPLQPGEQEVVLPNKKYKGSVELAAAKAATALPGFASSQIAPAKSFTSTFLKKALSKSGTPKKSKDKLKMLNGGVEKSASEPRKKKINFALTQNKSQDFVDHLKAVKSSPQTPHDPKRNPAKTLLKKRDSLESGRKLNPVGLNTQLNSRSKTAKILQKRAKAMDFF